MLSQVNLDELMILFQGVPYMRQISPMGEHILKPHNCFWEGTPWILSQFNMYELINVFSRGDTLYYAFEPSENTF